MVSYHITHHGRAWKLRRESSEEVILEAGSREELTHRAMEQFRGEEAMLRVHDEQGRLESEHRLAQLAPGGKLDINHASAEAIAAVAGIDRRQAEAIVEYRKQQPFFALEDLQEVPGVDGSIMALLMEKVEFRPPRH